jgi:hypothetical protein
MTRNCLKSVQSGRGRSGTASRLAVLTGLLTALCFVAIFSGTPAVVWVGVGGLAVLVVWVIVFQLLYRRGC